MNIKFGYSNGLSVGLFECAVCWGFTVLRWRHEVEGGDVAGGGSCGFVGCT
jgi:hypothetical protein